MFLVGYNQLCGLITVVDCYEIPIENNGFPITWYPNNLNGNDTDVPSVLYTSVVTYQCKTGCWYSKGIYESNVTCGPYGKWVPSYVPCVGRCYSDILNSCEIHNLYLDIYNPFQNIHNIYCTFHNIKYKFHYVSNNFRNI